MKKKLLYKFIINIIFKFLSYINNYVNNWGISIIIFAIILKILIYPLSSLQYTTMIKMNLLKPKIEKINYKYKDFNIKNRKILYLYKSQNIKMIYNIILLFIQIPIFFSLYNILTNFKELKNSKFLWINNLSLNDKYFILPILTGISIFYIQKNLSINNNSENNISICLISIIFTLFLIYIPSGLIIYYLINNILTILQQKIIYNQYIKNR